MTRRLEPMDRVKELGDASVPFTFDLHAMIFSENAPELENLLHREFNDRRINKVNYRKEYFRVSLDEIEQVIIEKYDKEVNFIKSIEAQQFRETKSIIKQLETAKDEQSHMEVEKYPDSLF
jgi:CO dehydrogenase/acetyl-CoA synthase beta subunit